MTDGRRQYEIVKMKSSRMEARQTVGRFVGKSILGAGV